MSSSKKPGKRSLVKNKVASCSSSSAIVAELVLTTRKESQDRRDEYGYSPSPENRRGRGGGGTFLSDGVGMVLLARAIVLVSSCPCTHYAHDAIALSRAFPNNATYSFVGEEADV